MRSRSEQSQDIPKVWSALAVLWSLDVNVQHCPSSTSHKWRAENWWCKNHHCYLFTERISASAASEEEKAIYISLISDLESKLRSHSSWLLRTVLSLEMIFLLWEQQQDMNPLCTALAKLWPPLPGVMLCYKGGKAKTERNTSAQRQVGEKSSGFLNALHD